MPNNLSGMLDAFRHPTGKLDSDHALAVAFAADRLDLEKFLKVYPMMIGNEDLAFLDQVRKAVHEENEHGICFRCSFQEHDRCLEITCTCCGGNK